MPPAFPHPHAPTPPQTLNSSAAVQREERRRKIVKFLEQGKAVIPLQGRYAGKKAVIVRVFEEGTRDHPYGHCLVAGLAKYPKKVLCKDSAKNTAKKSRVKVFLQLEDRFKTGKNGWFFTKLCMIRQDSRNANKIYYSSHDSA
ncbi:60S ribosomal protein L27 [Hordeum vulgare]|nr:60S ribosomal protein L27 [Hordeum vulgare]